MMKRPIQTAFALFCGVLLGADTTVPSNTVLAQPPGFGGGPPFGGGGPMGGPPSFGGGFGGREGGFGSRDGGSREGGSREGGFGGFDPSMFLGRMDRNGNGMLDLDEMEGPARFMIERMARGNPSIDMSKPIPLSKITEAFQAMRNGGSSSSSSSSDESMSESTTLVPGFGIKKEKVPVPGFGSNSSAINIRVEEQDIRDADDRMGRYDTNRDGVLDANEVTNSRMTDAMEYDRNGDGKVTRDELAVRYAKRRQSYSQSSQSSQDNSRRDSRDTRRETKDKDKESKEIPNPFEKIFSYRLTDKDGKLKRPAGLPEWFVRRDINVDNQVSMDEYSSKWNSDVIDEFAKVDANLDGFITSKECLAAVKKGFIPGSGGGSSVAAASSVATDTKSSAGVSTSSSGAGATASKAPVAGGVDPKMVAWMESRMKKYDKNGDNKLDVGEFKAYDANGDFGAVDQNKDGLADVTELVIARQKK